MPDALIQSSLFEEDYLLRELGQLAQVPQVALTELVANAWDAGATRVSLQLPAVLGGVLTVEDNGHGMRYDRLKRQSPDVEFPPGKRHRPRKPYGRNGVGRHGLLCFANRYRVETWREGVHATFEVATESGPSPFVLRSEVLGKRKGSGTKISVVVERKLPDADEILTVLAARFVHDPEFEILVNGSTRSFSEIEGRVSEASISLEGGRSANIIVIDTTRLNQSSIHQGIAFWVQRRLVGTPSWAVGQVANFDGRTRFARRYKVIVDTQGFEAEVEKDWSGFKASDAVRQLHQRCRLCCLTTWLAWIAF
jgi:Histidine kinase-, DNA gyrase B-, and HSP90-like ATPase